MRRSLPLVLALCALPACGPSGDARSPTRAPLATQWLERAKASFRSGDFDDAREASRKALAAAPADPDARELSARIALVRLDYAEALRLTEGLETSQVHGLRGRAYWLSGDVEHAADELEGLLADPNVKDSWAHDVAALARRGVGRHPFAMDGALVASVEVPRAIERVPLGAAIVVPCELDGERVLALMATGTSEVLVDSNPYALQTLKDALRVHLQARQYPVASLGPDPNRDMFGKAEATPWAIVPMATATQVYGQIAADMGRTDEEPTLDQLEFLTILGALATQALANDEILNLRSRLASDEAVKQVLHNAFHDIKTPAISIAANAEIAADRSRDPGKRDEALQSLLEDAKRMEHLIRQSSDYTWTGLGPQDPRRVSLREIVERGTRRLVPVAARAGVSLEVDLPNVPCEIEGDANRLYVALDNLVDNAIKFSPKGSSVWVRLKPGDRGYRVEVLDDGPGAPRDSKIFDPFVSVAHSGVPESSGLGLAITKKIIEDHGGALNYGTGTGGKGSVFSFLLPAVLLS